MTGGESLAAQLAAVQATALVVVRWAAAAGTALGLAAATRGPTAAPGPADPADAPGPFALAVCVALLAASVAVTVLVGRRAGATRRSAAEAGAVGVVVPVLAWSLPAGVSATLGTALLPLAVAATATVAVRALSTRTALAVAAVPAGGYLVAAVVRGPDAAGLLDAVRAAGWPVVAACCGRLLASRLREVAHRSGLATALLIAERERAAEHRAQADERLRSLRDRARRYRALHDGPMRLLTVIAGPGPAAHPDPGLREQCAKGVDLIRGTLSDDDGIPLTDLALALIEAGEPGGVHGLRVRYQFVRLAEDFPPPVVLALGQATTEALCNVALHADTGQAWVTATSTPRADGGRGVTVAVVDQGRGFDPATTEPGYGLRGSILGRLADVGGSATVDSRPGEGTRVELRWPA